MAPGAGRAIGQRDFFVRPHCISERLPLRRPRFKGGVGAGKIVAAAESKKE